MLVAVAALGFLAYKTFRQGQGATFVKSIREMDMGWGLGALGLYFVAQTLLGSRWVVLLRVHGVAISQFQAIKLTYLGLFYNNMMPGAVGGDLLKGWYITRHSDKQRRLEAAVTVFVDRLTGLVGMILVGALASCFEGGKLIIPIGERWELPVRTMIWGVFLGLVFVAVLFLSRHVRRALFLNVLLEKLPFAGSLKKIDSAIRIYRSHVGVLLWALLLTAVIQGLAIMATWMLAQALGYSQVKFFQCLIIMPIVWLISAAIPVPGGLGVMENLFVPFFAKAIDPMVEQRTDRWLEVVAMAAALAVMNRLMICLCSLPGGLVPIFGGHLPKRAEIEAELASEEDG